MGKIVKEEKNTYVVKKGSDDYRVWTIGVDFLYEYMCNKRKSRFTGIKTKRDIKVTIIVQENEKQQRRLGDEKY